MSKILESDYLEAKGIVKQYEDNYFKEIRNGNHKQFKLDTKLGVICRCGKKAVKIRVNELFICSTFTAYNCDYSKK